jgi:hypothetical protein
MEFYRLEPTRMVLIDNSRGFGHKDTLDLTLSNKDGTDEKCGLMR